MYRAIPRAYWDWVPASWEACPGETFSFREHACHVRDFDTVVYHPRIRRTRDEHQPVLERIFGHELAKQNNYSAMDPLEALHAFAQARSETLKTVRSLSEAQLQRTADLAQYGVITLGGLVHLLCDHDLRHLACVHWLSAKMACQQP